MSIQPFHFADVTDGSDARILRNRTKRPLIRRVDTAQFDFPVFDKMASAPDGDQLEEQAEPTYGQAELDAALEEASRSAEAATEVRVRADMIAGIDHRHAEALTAIARHLEASQAAIDRWTELQAGTAHELALALTRTLVPLALEQQPFADIEAMLRSTIARLVGQPWLELRLPPDLIASGADLLAAAAEDASFQGELRILPDAALRPGDARLAWQDGAAERDLARLEAAALALARAWLPAASAFHDESMDDEQYES